MSKLYATSAVGGLVACAAMAVAQFAWREPMPSVPATPQILFRPAQSLAPELNERRYAPDDRIALVQDLQRNLQRLGCYGGTVNGVWTPATRDAMRAFIDRVNARLPTDEPDEFLLNLAASHEEKACVDKAVYVKAVAAPTRTETRSTAAIETGAIDKPNAAAGSAEALPTFVPVAGLGSRIETIKLVETVPPPTVYATPVKTAAAGGDQDLIADWLDSGSQSRSTSVVPSAAAAPDPVSSLPSVSVQQSGPDQDAVVDRVGPAQVTYTPDEEPSEAHEQARERPPKAKRRKRLRSMNNYSKPPKFVKSIMRDVQSAFSSLGLN